jgi:hypothetical protein
VLVRGEQHDFRAVGELHFGADDEGDTGLFRRCFAPASLRFAGRGERAHDTGHRAFVGDRECGVAERFRAFEQFLRARRTALEREVRQAMQFGIGRHLRVGSPGWSGVHANQPCSVQFARVSASTKTQARWPERSSTT